MAGEIIRLGDPTSHGGRVLEGSQLDICHGKPISYIGHQTWCPLCKGHFAIIEGSMLASFYGKGVALAGMKTACGATLIATQFTDTVEWSRASNNSATYKAARNPIPVTATSTSRPLVGTPITQTAASNNEEAFDLFFQVQNDATGKTLGNLPYRITLEDGREFRGETDAYGHTEKVSSAHLQSATIEVPFYDYRDANTTVEPDPSHCQCCA